MRLTRNGVLQSFALAVIRHQPLAYARTVLGDMEHYASFGRTTGRRDEAIGEWQFHVIVRADPASHRTRRPRRAGGAARSAACHRPSACCGPTSASSTRPGRCS